LLHALEDVINPKAVFPDHALLPGTNQVLFANPFVRPEQRHVVIAGELPHPGLIVAGTLGQDFLGDFGLLADLSEEIDHIVCAGQKGKVSIDDDTVKAVIKPLQIWFKQFKKALHWRPFLGFEYCNENTRRGPSAFQAPTSATPI